MAPTCYKSVGLFCFRRDLRLDDNYALIDLSKKTSHILPVFCFDPQQVDSTRNKYYSAHCVRFMLDALKDLDSHIHTHTKTARLMLCVGAPEVVLPKLVQHLWDNHLSHDADSSKVFVAWNEDNTPYSTQRDETITSTLRKQCQHIPFQILTRHDDCTIVPIRDIRTNGGNKYQVYTPFYKKALELGVKKPLSAPKDIRYIQVKLSNVSDIQTLSISNLFHHVWFRNVAKEKTIVQGGRTHGLERLKKTFLWEHCNKYSIERNHTWKDKTTRLSAYFKFGCVSFREAYWAMHAALKKKKPKEFVAITNELFWNAFYSYISYSFPHVLEGQTRTAPAKSRKNNDMKMAKQPKTLKIWAKRTSASVNKELELWKKGKTGFPMVDAAMRQLNSTHWMHNRTRMLVASFLTKDLRIDWREGELYFAQQLVDYDPSANNGGWQWAASTGADAQPYNRIFNPWSQSERFDPHAEYIKTYVPELKDVDAKDIHTWMKDSVRNKYPNVSYPAPMLDHSVARKKTISLWKKS